MVVQWLRLHVPNAGGKGSIPSRGTKTLHATWYGQKKKKRVNINETWLGIRFAGGYIL